jgi:hypothetical protein
MVHKKSDNSTLPEHDAAQGLQASAAAAKPDFKPGNQQSEPLPALLEI